MYRQPFEQLLNLRRDYDSYIIAQSPYIDYIGYTKWSDFSVFDKKKGVDLRIEVSSLKPLGSDLQYRALKYPMECTRMIEKQMVLVLLDKGYDEIAMLCLKNMIEAENLPIIIIQSMEEFEKFIDELFK